MKKALNLKRHASGNSLTDGQSLVEFALVLPILLLLILGMIEFGWILNGKITLTSAVREGARAAIVCETIGDAQAKASTAVTNSVSGSSLKSVNTTVYPFDVYTHKTKVTVTAKITPIIGIFYGGDVDLTVEAEMRIE